MEEITKAYSKSKSFSASSWSIGKFTRIFDEQGKELKEMNKIMELYVKSNEENKKKKDDELKSLFVWVSRGENRREHKDATLALSISLNMLFAMKNPPPPEPTSFIKVDNLQEAQIQDSTKSTGN